MMEFTSRQRRRKGFCFSLVAVIFFARPSAAAFRSRWPPHKSRLSLCNSVIMDRRSSLNHRRFRFDLQSRKQEYNDSSRTTTKSWKQKQPKSSEMLPVVRWTTAFSVVLLLFLVSVNAPAALAVDHPIDHSLLGIPIPVPDARYFISGGICAAASHGVTVPRRYKRASECFVLWSNVYFC